MLSPTIPVHRRHSPVSPIIPVHTQKQRDYPFDKPKKQGILGYRDRVVASCYIRPYVGGCFMGDEELRREKMQVLFDYEETAKQLSARRAQIQRIGEDIHALGQMMVNFPEHVFFSGDSVPVELASVHAHDPEILNAAKIREATGSGSVQSFSHIC
jgi:hypothetical protein